MKKVERKALREKLLVAIKKVITFSKTELSTKNEKDIKKFIKKIVKTTDKKANP